MENTSFGGFSADCPNHLAAVGRILNFGGLAIIFAGLEFAGLLNLHGTDLLRRSAGAPATVGVSFLR
jgi:hypothetical protein